jgi:hypothetical protein
VIVDARMTLFLDEDAPLTEQAYALESGGVDGCVRVGEFVELSVWGSPAALRRFAVVVTAAADAADQLAERERQGEPAAAGPAR